MGFWFLHNNYMASKTTNKSKKKMWGAIIPGLVLIGMGVIFLLNNYGYTTINFGNIWPIFLIIPGVYMLFGIHQRD